MKHLTIAALCLFILNTNSFGQSIVTHWNNAMKAHDGLYHPVKKIGKSYKTLDDGGDYSIDVTVDAQNGYLTYSDPGTGGGVVTIEAAIFKGNGQSFLVYKAFFSDGFGELRTGCFLIGAGYPEAPAVLPAPDVRMFFGNSLVAAPEDDVHYVKSLFNMDLQVPRIGTTAKYVINQKMAESTCASMEHTGCKYLRNVQATQLELVWIKKENRFDWKR